MLISARHELRGMFSKIIIKCRPRTIVTVLVLKEVYDDKFEFIYTQNSQRIVRRFF